MSRSLYLFHLKSLPETEFMKLNKAKSSEIFFDLNFAIYYCIPL